MGQHRLSPMRLQPSYSLHFWEICGESRTICRIIILSLIILCLSFKVKAQTTNTDQTRTSKSFNERALGATEGCFNTMSPLLVVTFSLTDILSNAKCQSLCGDHGFVVAATSNRECQCGNIYPAIYHRVDDRHCNDPCSLDRSTCNLSGCCGDKTGKYYTISFAGEIEPRLELLRRLTYDYREKSPLFRNYIEGLMAQTTTLQVLRSSSGESMRSDKGNSSSSSSNLNNTTTSSAGPVTSSFLGVGAGCPKGWQVIGDSCYQATTVTDVGVTYLDAQASCKNAGGMLASIGSSSHNLASKQLLQGQIGWLGLTTFLHADSSYTWSWDEYAAWDTQQPDKSSNALRSSQAYGPVAGGAFDDYTRNTAGISSITLGYTLGSLVSMQVSYLLKDGNIYSSPLRGAEGRSRETLTLQPGERIVKIEGVASSKNIQGLTIQLIDSAKNLRTWGPIGSSAKPTFTYRPSSEVIAFYGRFSEQTVNQLGFYEYRGKACTQMNDQGLWEAIYCDEKLPSPFYLCEKVQEKKRRDCPTGWVNLGLSCLRSFQSDAGMSWQDASAACLTQGALLASIDSAAKKNAAWALLQGARGFIGLHDALASSTDSYWTWQYYENWDSNQPAPVLKDETKVDPGSTCAVMSVSSAAGKWSTVKCSVALEKVRAICEVPVLDEDCSCPPNWVALDCSCYYISTTPTTYSWLDAQSFCSNLIKGGSLPLPRSSSINQRLLQALGAGTWPIFLGLRDTFSIGTLIPQIFTTWGGGEEPVPASNYCGSMRSDGNWYGIDCTSRLKAFVCRIPKAAAAAYVGGESQQFQINLLPGQEVVWGTPLDIQIQQADTGQHLAMDREGNVFPMGTTDGSDHVSTTFTFTMVDDEQSQISVGAFLLKSKEYGDYLYSDPSTGQLRAMKASSSSDTAAAASPMDLVRDGYASLFMASQLVPAFGIQNLAISIVTKGSAEPNPVLCSMYVYDLTADSSSYKCYEVQGDTDGLPVVSLDLAAWANQDKANVLMPRVPLDFGRYVCENQSPFQSSTCSATYGQALLVQSWFHVLNGYQLMGTYEINDANSPDGNFWNMADLYTNTYTDITQVQYLQTNQYSSFVPIPPQSTIVLQFWQSTVNLNYVWSALFSATGSFQLTSLGMNLDSPRSITTVSDTRDLLFYMWGRIQYDTQGEVMISNNMIQYASWPFDPPNLSNV